MKNYLDVYKNYLKKFEKTFLKLLSLIAPVITKTNNKHEGGDSCWLELTVIMGYLSTGATFTHLQSSEYTKCHFLLIYSKWVSSLDLNSQNYQTCLIFSSSWVQENECCKSSIFLHYMLQLLEHKKLIQLIWLFRACFKLRLYSVMY